MALTINHQTNDISATSGSVTIDGSSVGGGVIDHITSVTIASATSTVDITLPSGYDRFELVFNLQSSAKAHLYMAFSEDNGSTYLITQNTNSSQNSSYSGSLTWSSASYSGVIAPDRAEYLFGSVRLHNAGANSDTVFEGICHSFAGAGMTTGGFMHTSGRSTSQTSRINRVQMRATGAYVWNSGKFSLYGIKEA